jgi:hypothetical protein
MHPSTMTNSRALALLAAFASPLFMAAAVAGWLSDTWPATPLTLALAAFAVIGGPVLGILHVTTAEEDAQQPVLALVPAGEARRRRIPLDAVSETQRLAAARRFHSWRDRPNDTISRREREEHLRRIQVRARELRRASRA